MRYTHGELFLPVAVEDYMACCQLMSRTEARQPVVVLDRGEVTLERLVAAGLAEPSHRLYLRLVEHPLSRWETFRWRRRPDRPRFVATSRLAQVGVLSRVIDALVRVSLVIRGTVATGTEAAADAAYRAGMRPGRYPYYGRVVRTAGYVALQYWFFYPFNDWRSRAGGVNDHEADWEQVVVYLAEQPDGSARPAWVAFSAHDEVGDDLRRRWDDPDLTVVDGHPVVFAGLGSHSGAYLAGDYLTTFEPPSFAGLVAAFRRLSRLLLPWTSDQEGAGVGIPYIDYARGDGPAIGPGQSLRWTPVVIGDDTPWVVDYRGLWGNDTDDPLGGERGPAGPRYERSGAVRHCWGDVVDWSGLAKVAPNAEVAAELVGRRLDELGREAAAVAADLDRERSAARALTAIGPGADAANGLTTGPSDDALHSLAARQVAVGDERRRLHRLLHAPRPQPGPHDHLRHRRLPQPVEPRVRRRMLTLWAAVSTPAILAVIALAFHPANTTSTRGLALSTTVTLLTIEAAARRRLLQFAVIVVAVQVGLSLALLLAGLVFSFGWAVAVMAVFATLSVLLLLANLLELRRR